tara:strand:- start:244 stop:522 length:279 start_codon:yes stop_codon:yes gene_type:complete
MKITKSQLKQLIREEIIREQAEEYAGPGERESIAESLRNGFEEVINNNWAVNTMDPKVGIVGDAITKLVNAVLRMSGVDDSPPEPGGFEEMF